MQSARPKMNPRLVSPRAAVALPALDLAHHIAALFRMLKEVFGRPLFAAPAKVRAVSRSVGSYR
jgi:hypothetical protein